MDMATRAILSDPDLLNIREVHFKRLEALFAGEPLEYAFVLNGVLGHASTDPYAEPERWVEESLKSLVPHGEHTQHIPVWREMLPLRAIQLNDRASEDLEAYFQGLRGDQILYLNPTPTMTVERAIQITGGRRLVIVAEVDAPIPLGF